MQVTGFLVLVCTSLLCANANSQSNRGSLPAEQVPAKTLPLPRDVGPEMQRIAAPLNPGVNQANFFEACFWTGCGTKRRRLSTPAARSSHQGWISQIPRP